MHRRGHNPSGAAREQLSRLAFGKQGRLDCRSDDRYGRSICRVDIDGVDVGLRMLELGLAWHFKRYARLQPREEAARYASEESAPRAAKVGLWGDLGTAAEPVAPWDWRKTSRVEPAR